MADTYSDGVEQGKAEENLRVKGLLAVWRDNGCFCEEIQKDGKEGICSYHGTYAILIDMLDGIF